jgi:hypothetical protein
MSKRKNYEIILESRREEQLLMAFLGAVDVGEVDRILLKYGFKKLTRKERDNNCAIDLVQGLKAQLDTKP